MPEIDFLNKKTLTGVKPVNNNKAQVSLPALTDAQKNELEKNKTLTIGDNQAYKYIYPGTSDAVGYFKYIYTISETPGGSIQNHKAGMQQVRLKSIIC